MSDDEAREWVQMLGRTRDRQIAAITELLRYSRQDDMAREDRVVCLAQLRRLKDEQSGWRKVN